MIPLTLQEVAGAVDGRIRDGSPSLEVTEVTTDSRRVPPGSLFVALRGEQQDGHDYIDQALTSGAAAYLAERAAGARAPGIVVPDTWRALGALARSVRERTGPTVVAVTGSVGKTTTKDLIAAAVGAERRVVAAPGSYNNELGVPLTCLALTSDTEVLVAEVGSRGLGDIAALTPILRPDVAVVTAVTGAHLETFGDIATVAAAKGELVEALGSDGTAVLNADDPRVLTMASRTAARVVTFACRVHHAEVRGRRRPVDVRAGGITTDELARARFTAVTSQAAVVVHLPVAGAHHVANALAALAVAGQLGVDPTRSAAALSRARISAWRSHVERVNGVAVLNDAYNANPASTAAALETLAALRQRTGGRAWAVLGVMAELGAASRQAHRRVGRHCAELGVDGLVLVGEQAAVMAEGARAAGLAADRCWQVADADQALAELCHRVRPGDAVLVKASRIAGLEKVAAGLREAAGPHGTGEAGR